MKLLGPVDDNEDVIALVEVATTPRYVDHGSNASTARPSGSRPVIWRGTVEPTNMINGDEWEQEGISYQAADADLTAIAGLDSSTAGAIASDGAGWIKKTYAQFKTALGLVKADVGLSNVDNTSDANKPVSTAQQTALNGKQNLDSDLTAIAGLDSATAGAIASDGAGWVKKTYAQFKTALALVKADVGLANVDNTSDANKPVSTAQQTALDARLLERGDVTLGPLFLGTDITNTFTSGQLTRTDHYRQDAVLRAREDFTYNGDGTLNTATKTIYADDGTTVAQTVSETYSYTSGELTGVARTIT